MNKSMQDLFVNLSANFFGYLPSLFAGIILVIIGWLLGWFIKRVIIQIALILRLERFLVRFRWGEDFSKADVRYGFYSFLGNIFFFFVFLVFLNDAFSVWKLTVLSTVLEKGILFFPKIFVALILFGFGWLVSSWTSTALLKAMRREEIHRATLIARFTKSVLLLFFSAMALTEINIAREIVVIGFATIFVTLGVLTIVLATVSGKSWFQKVQDSLEEEKG